MKDSFETSIQYLPLASNHRLRVDFTFDSDTLYAKRLTNSFGSLPFCTLNNQRDTQFQIKYDKTQFCLWVYLSVCY